MSLREKGGGGGLDSAQNQGPHRAQKKRSLMGKARFLRSQEEYLLGCLPRISRVRAGKSAVQDFLMPTVVLYMGTHWLNCLPRVNKRHRLVRTTVRTRWIPRPCEYNIKTMRLMYFKGGRGVYVSLRRES